MGMWRGVMVHGLINVEGCQRWRVGIGWADLPKRWKEVLNNDFRARGVSPSWAKDRDRWRAACIGDPNVNRDPHLHGGRRRPFSSE